METNKKKKTTIKKTAVNKKNTNRKEKEVSQTWKAFMSPKKYKVEIVDMEAVLQ